MSRIGSHFNHLLSRENLRHPFAGELTAWEKFDCFGAAALMGIIFLPLAPLAFYETAHYFRARKIKLNNPTNSTEGVEKIKEVKQCRLVLSKKTIPAPPKKRTDLEKLRLLVDDLKLESAEEDEDIPAENEKILQISEKLKTSRPKTTAVFLARLKKEHPKIFLALLDQVLRDKEKNLVKACLRGSTEKQKKDFLAKYSEPLFHIRKNPEDEPTIVRANKELLSHYNSYFRSLFEESQSPIEISDVDPAIFELFLNSIYFREIDISKDNYDQLLMVVYEYESEALFDTCLRWMESAISASNFQNFLETVALWDECLDPIADHARRQNFLTIKNRCAEWMIANCASFDSAALFKIAEKYHLPLVQQALFLNRLQKDENDEVLKEWGAKLTGLTLPNDAKIWFTTKHLKKVVKACPNLEKLSLRNCAGLKFSSIYKLKMLKKLDLTSTNISSASVQEIVKNMPSLKKLILGSFFNADAECLHVIAKSLPDLEELDLRSCHTLGGLNLDDDGIKMEDWEGILEMTKLKKLTLSSCPAINDETLFLIATLLPDLQVLKLAYCGNLTSQGLEAAAPSLSQLEELDLSHTAVGLSESAVHLKNLKRLYLNTCLPHSPEDLQAIVTHMTNLEVLDLSNSMYILDLDNCTSLTDEFFQGIQENMPNLRILDLRSCNFEQCSIITKKKLRNLAKNESNLQLFIGKRPIHGKKLK